MTRDCVVLVGTFLVLTLSTACGNSEERSDGSAAGAPEVGGLTREQVQEHAEAMSPEVAESLGIVDTTIGIQSPAPVESLRPPPSVVDSTPSP